MISFMEASKPKILVRGEFFNRGDGRYTVDVETPRGIERVWALEVRRVLPFGNKYRTIEYPNNSKRGEVFDHLRKRDVAHRFAYEQARAVASAFQVMNLEYRGYEILDDNSYHRRMEERRVRKEKRDKKNKNNVAELKSK